MWQQVTSNGVTTATIWIGGIYEEKGGKTLCHVFADGKRVATFEPVTGFAAFIQQRPVLAALDKWLKTAATWPLRDGRAPLTTTLIPLLGVLCASVVSRRFSRRRRSDLPVATLRQYRWYLTHDPIARSPIRRFFFQLINVILIVAVFVAVTPTNVNAQTFDPVFYYYHSDHLGSSNVMTDRDGELVQRYEYTAFGKERFVDNSQAFSVSHRYTGQIFDEATGLYYYNARYYDPELGRFIQADTIVSSAGDPQTLNRYSYVRNNPLVYTDPSGHDPVTAVLVAVVISVAVNVAVAAATGGNIGLAIATGVVGGLLGGLGAFALGPFIGSSIGSTFWGAVIGGAIGGAAGGAATAAITGGDIGLGALSGGIGGAIGGAVGFKVHGWELPARAAAQVIAGSVGGGIGAAIHGGNVGLGFAWGAAGAAIGSVVGEVIGVAAEVRGDHELHDRNNPSKQAMDYGTRPIKDEIIADAAVKAKVEAEVLAPSWKNDWEYFAHVYKNEKTGEIRINAYTDKDPYRVGPRFEVPEPGWKRLFIMHTHPRGENPSYPDAAWAGYPTVPNYVVTPVKTFGIVRGADPPGYVLFTK